MCQVPCCMSFLGVGYLWSHVPGGVRVEGKISRGRVQPGGGEGRVSEGRVSRE